MVQARNAQLKKILFAPTTKVEVSSRKLRITIENKESKYSLLAKTDSKIEENCDSDSVFDSLKIFHPKNHTAHFQKRIFEKSQ